MNRIEYLYSIDDPLIKNILQHQFVNEVVSEKSGYNEPSQIMKFWIEKLVESVNRLTIHGGFDYCFENAASKILQLEIYNSKIKEIELYLIDLLKHAIKNVELLRYQEFDINIILSYLLNRKYNNQLLLDYGMKRIDDVFGTIKKYGTEIFVRKELYSSIPNAFKDKQLVNPEITKKALVSLPVIYDLQYFHIIGQYDSSYLKKVNEIFKFVLSIDYQKIPEGYGIMQFEKKKYYAIGWSITLPGYIQDIGNESIIFYLNLFSKYKSAHSSDWFRNQLLNLHEYKTADELYEYPKEWIREQKGKYALGGNHLGVIENRRIKDRNKIESTYWYEKIMLNIRNAI